MFPGCLCCLRERSLEPPTTCAQWGLEVTLTSTWEPFRVRPISWQGARLSLPLVQRLALPHYCEKRHSAVLS